MRAADFIEETATAIAGPSGNGDVTLGQSGTRPRFSHAYPSGAWVRYVIEDTVSGKLESGIGYVASNVLTRNKPRTTWDGTAYNNKAPTALAFGSAPAAGKVLVRLAQVADTSSASVQSFSATNFGNIDTVWAQYPLSSHFTNWPNGNSYTVVNGNDYYIYYRLETGGSLQGVQFEVTGAQGAGATAKLALYELGIDGLPAKKILDFADVDMSTTGVKTIANPALWTPAENVYLSPGWYAVALRPLSAASGTIKAGTNGNSTNQLTTPLGKTTSYVGYKSMINRGNGYDTNGLPATPDFTTGGPVAANASVWLGMKVVP